MGYAKDRFTTEHLTATAPGVYEQYKAATPSKFLFLKEVTGLDGTKLSEAQSAATKNWSKSISTAYQVAAQSGALFPLLASPYSDGGNPLLVPYDKLKANQMPTGD